MSVGLKKISPGAHWLGITGIACEKTKKNFAETMQINTLVAIRLMDSFIACWDEKYRSNRIRPETFINRYIDVKWQPVLQTPPFPEYTSVHSVVSTASAQVLTYLFGDNFFYTDVTEIPFGSGQRSFKSFREAAAEASISRLYGGIHYWESIDSGVTEGKLVGNYIVSKIKQAGILPQNEK